MKVILLADVPKLGTVGQIAEVSSGYARNHLIPKRLARPATSGVLRDQETRHLIAAHRARLEMAKAQAVASKLQGASVIIPARVGSEGRIHGRVTNQQVAEALLEQVNIEIDRHRISILDPIRSLGIFTLPVRIATGLEASITVEVMDLDELAAEAEAMAREQLELQQAAEAE